jgi:hypothetical protein
MLIWAEPSKGSIVGGNPDLLFMDPKRTPYATGTFTWSIPWYYKVDGKIKNPLPFAIVTHCETINSAGDVSLSKAGITCSAALNDPSSTYGD